MLTNLMRNTEEYKTGMIAIISHNRDVPVSETEISDFATVYESFRGQGRRDHAVAGDFARVVKVSSGDGYGIEVLNSSWVAATGVVCYQGPLVGARVDQLDGHFGLISYDALSDEVVVVTDPFAMYGLYIAEQNNKTYISTSSLALAKHLQSKPSRLGLNVFLRAGYHFGALTNWEGIERLDPGTGIWFTRSGRQQRRYWHCVPDESIERLGFSQAVDYCVEVMNETCRTYLADRPPTWSDLTGGYDSRLLNLVLAKVGVDFRTCTRGDEHDEEVQIAKQVARTTGWEWTCFTVPYDWDQLLPELFPIALAWGDAQLEILQLSRPMWKHAQTGRTHRSLLGGGGGGIFGVMLGSRSS